MKTVRLVSAVIGAVSIEAAALRCPDSGMVQSDGDRRPSRGTDGSRYPRFVPSGSRLGLWQYEYRLRGESREVGASSLPSRHARESREVGASSLPSRHARRRRLVYWCTKVYIFGHLTLQKGEWCSSIFPVNGSLPITDDRRLGSPCPSSM